MSGWNWVDRWRPASASRRTVSAVGDWNWRQTHFVQGRMPLTSGVEARNGGEREQNQPRLANSRGHEATELPIRRARSLERRNGQRARYRRGCQWSPEPTHMHTCLVWCGAHRSGVTRVPSSQGRADLKSRDHCTQRVCVCPTLSPALGRADLKSHGPGTGRGRTLQRFKAGNAGQSLNRVFSSTPVRTELPVGRGSGC